MIVSTLWEDPCVGGSGERRDYNLGGDSIQVYKTLREVAPANPPLQPSPSANPTRYKPVIQLFAVLRPNLALQPGTWVFMALQDHFSAPSQGLRWKTATSRPRSTLRRFSYNKSKSANPKLVFRIRVLYINWIRNISCKQFLWSSYLKTEGGKIYYFLTLIYKQQCFIQ